MASTCGRTGRVGYGVLCVAFFSMAGCGSDSGGGGGAGGAGGGGGTGDSGVTPPSPVNLVADSNRNGLLELGPQTDEVGEDKWTPQAGAVFLVNIDDDDGDGKPDNADEIVNGPADELDLARFSVAPWPDAPDTATGSVTFEPSARPYVRVFRKGPTGWTKVDTNAGVTLNATDLRGVTEFAIEGLDFIRKLDQFWQGLVSVALNVSDDRGPVGGNAIQLKQAPWLINHNLRPFDRVYNSNFSPRLTGSLPAPLDEFGVQNQTWPDTYNGGTEDIWYEDWMQTGYTEMPALGGNGDVHGMVIFNPRPWGRADGQEPVKFLREHMLGPDVGVAVFFNEQTELEKGDSFDSHGNHEALPPYPAAPAGRILHGSGILQSTRDFYAAQQVQPPIALKTDWLIVGHMDEVYASVRAATPNGFKLLQNTPSLGRQMFKDWEAQGHGSAVVFEGLTDFDGKQWQTTVAGINANAELMAWNQEAQVNVDGMHEQLLAEAGLTEDDVIPIPVLYEEVDGGKIAYLPDTANVRVINRGEVTIFAKTFGPMIDGQDAFKNFLETYLVDPKFKLGKDGNGPKVRFADSWDYHVLLGDVHCASNWSALPTREEPRWWEGLK